MHELFRRHHDWWLKHRSSDTARHCLLGMLKAVRNFVHPLLKPPAIGVDNRPAAVEAIGDMLMYCWSLHHVRNKPLDSWPLYEQPNVDYVLGSLLIELGCQLKGYVSHETLWTHIAVLAHTCCIPLEEAAAISIEKLPC